MIESAAIEAQVLGVKDEKFSEAQYSCKREAKKKTPDIAKPLPSQCRARCD